MSQTRKKILISALTGLTLAARSAFDALNDDGRFDGSAMDQDPVRYAQQLANAIQLQVAAIEEMEPYEDFSPEELAAHKAHEQKVAQKKLQDEAAASLKAMKAAREAPAAVAEEEPEDEDPGDGEDLEEDDLDQTGEDENDPEGENDPDDSVDGVEGTQEQTDAEPGEGEQLPGSADLQPVAPAEPVAPEAVVPAPAKPAAKPKAPKAKK